MAPTHGQEEIEGRYKEYAYSPVPSSSSSAVCDSTTLGKYPVEIGVGSSKYCTNGVHDKCRVANMAEKGSTLPQYVAAAAGKFQPFSFSRVKQGLARFTVGLKRIFATERRGIRFARQSPSTIDSIESTVSSVSLSLVNSVATKLFGWQAFRFHAKSATVRGG
ncbi:hypothetical protein K0M31_000650 [Melipona bicolor]|uniref:Uncharacterized protein n=1 Tax=Melipona bicolor TaxID=60889 RepID=A0AA40GDY6_9HYME|nr:hypothetical protein K0M31_000650 [Melipona bicolor]